MTLSRGPLLCYCCGPWLCPPGSTASVQVLELVSDVRGAEAGALPEHPGGSAGDGQLDGWSALYSEAAEERGCARQSAWAGLTRPSQSAASSAVRTRSTVRLGRIKGYTRPAFQDRGYGGGSSTTTRSSANCGMSAGRPSFQIHWPYPSTRLNWPDVGRGSGS